jgi:DNA-binding XRE family transcriptional regulator
MSSSLCEYNSPRPAIPHAFFKFFPRPEKERKKKMKAQRVFRANRKTAEERVRERTLREQLQKERPSLQDLIRTGACDPEAVMSMGMYFDVQKALQALKAERKRCGLSIGNVAERSGLDRAVVGRLENGKQDNPTVATLMRYAAAIGKRFTWCFENQPSTVINGRLRKKTNRRRASI